MNMQNVSDIYPLSPLQRVMLLHELCLPQSRANFVQTSYLLQGPLRPEVFKAAWQQVVERHPVLRTLFLEEGLEEPLQVVCQQAELPWVEDDWRAFSDVEQELRLQELLQEDCAQGISFAHAPLVRLTLLRLKEETYHFTWSFHHLILDGWSSPPVLNEAFALYEDLCQGRASSLPAVRPYRDYISWLLQQDYAQAERLWREELKGFTTPTLLQTPNSSPAGEERYVELGWTLPVSLTTSLQGAARQYQVTLNTLLLGAWALLLSRYTSSMDIVFGATVSGRPDNLPGAETMVGMFINIVPVRVRIPHAADLATWLQDLQNRQMEMRRYEYCSLLQIREWSEVPWDLPLFESLLVFENYPLAGEEAGGSGRIHLRQSRASVRTNYPLTLVLEPQAGFALHLVYDVRHFTEAAVEDIAASLNSLLAALAQTPRSLADLLTLVPESGRFLTSSPVVSPPGQVSHGTDPDCPVVAPRNTLELRLVRIWEKLLGIHPVGVTDHFFSLGGQSLLAIRLMTHIQNQFGRNFPLSLLFQGGTIEQIAEYLQAHTQVSPQSSLVAIQPYGHNPPLFCLHPALGSVFCYYQLSRYLSPAQPLYALQDLDVYAEEACYVSLEDLAARYISEIRSVQPGGPYLLCGFSLGGLLAFEIAQQLRNQGQEIALLALLDSAPPAAAGKFKDDAAYLAVIMLELLRGSTLKGLQDLYQELLPLEPEERFAFILRTVETATGRPAEIGTDWLRLELSIFKQRIRAVENYTVRSYGGQITLFCAGERDEFEYANQQVEQAEDLGWGQFAEQPLALYRLPGYHDTLLDEPVIQMLAEQLQHCLDKAIAEISWGDKSGAKRG